MSGLLCAGDDRLPQELIKLRQRIRHYIAEEVAPIEAGYADEIRDTGTFANLATEKKALRRRSAARGFYSAFMPRSCGGGGVGHLGLAVAIEEAHRHGLLLPTDGGLIPDVEGPTTILLDGTSDQQESYLLPTMRAEREACFALTEAEAGSDASRLRTRAERTATGWRINGRKQFITHGADADYVILFATTNPDLGAMGGVTAFLVDAETPGFSVIRRHRTMWDQHQAELGFDDCLVGDDAVLGRVGRGFPLALRWLSAGRITAAAMAVGIAAHLLERMTDHARTRSAFGQKIGVNQYVQGMVVDSAAELAQARLLLYDRAAAIDAGGHERGAAAVAKLVATEMAGRVADRAIQVFGGHGYMVETGIERWARIVRAMRLYEGTSEILRITVAQQLGLPMN